MVLIPNANIEDHIKRTADELSHVLHSKKDIIPAMQTNSVQGTLIKIAQLLHRDEIPYLPLIPQDNVVSSEGAGKTIVPPIEVNRHNITTSIQKL